MFLHQSECLCVHLCACECACVHKGPPCKCLIECVGGTTTPSTRPESDMDETHGWGPLREPHSEKGRGEPRKQPCLMLPHFIYYLLIPCRHPDIDPPLHLAMAWKGEKSQNVYS